MDGEDENLAEGAVIVVYRDVRVALVLSLVWNPSKTCASRLGTGHLIKMMTVRVLRIGGGKALFEKRHRTGGSIIHRRILIR